MTGQEYAKVRAVLERIRGLRRAMVVTAVIGVFTSYLVSILVGIRAAISLSPNALGEALEYGIVSFIPFVAIIGYFSYRVNKHIDRLSKGKFEPPVLIE